MGVERVGAQEHFLGIGQAIIVPILLAVRNAIVILVGAEAVEAMAEFELIRQAVRIAVEAGETAFRSQSNPPRSSRLR